MEVQLDMGDGFVLSKSADNITKIGQIPQASLPGLGETLTIELEEAPNDLKSCSMKFSRNEEVIGKVQVPRHRYIPSLESKEGLSVMIHPLLQEVLDLPLIFIKISDDISNITRGTRFTHNIHKVLCENTSTITRGTRFTRIVIKFSAMIHPLLQEVPSRFTLNIHKVLCDDTSTITRGTRFTHDSHKVLCFDTSTITRGP